MGVYNYDAINDELVPIAGTSAEQGLSDKVSKYSADSTYWDTTPTSSSTKPVTSGGILADINSKVSHENLLDNPWFTVNQRGFTSGNPEVPIHVADRWAVRYNPSNSGSVSLSNNILTLTSTGNLLIVGERFEEAVGFSGKTLTASILLSDGTIYYGTGVFPSKNGSDLNVIDTNDFTVYYQYSSSSGNYPFLGVLCKANKTISIKAVKLELGSVSTLANDTAPNYAEELVKCQRYFYKTMITTKEGSQTTSKLSNATNTNFLTGVDFPVQMRDIPTYSNVKAQDFFGTVLIDNVVFEAATKDGVCRFYKQNAFTQGTWYYMQFEASADL